VGDGPLIHAVRLNGHGGGTALAWGQLDAPPPDGEFVWIHLNRTNPQAQHWLRHDAGLDPIVTDALLAEETRPRCTEHDGGLLLNLRGVNLNPEADPEDMLSIRIWVTATRVISARRHPLLAIRDVCSVIDQGTGPPRRACWWRSFPNC
jgi:zinc transporter